MSRPTRSPVEWSRRAFLVASTAVVSAACSGPAASGGGSAPTPSGASEATATLPGSPSARASTPSPPLPPARPWRAGPGEVRPEVKRTATALLEALGTWQRDEGSPPAARRRAGGLGADPALAGQVADALLGPESAAVLRVVDAQYGGILSDAASVLCVVEQWRSDGTGVRHGGTTVDVRLVRREARWRVTSLRPAQPAPAARSSGAAARAVLAEPRIHLPFAARSDVASGTVHESVLTALLGLSRAYVLDVSVLRSGHPIDVFGTARPSDHPRGRAADIWAFDGRPVVDPRNRPLVVEAMRRAKGLGPYQVGGPVDLDGSGTGFFSDATHQDHVHLGFRG